MRKTISLLIGAVIAFAFGWYISMPSAANAAPVYRWTTAQEAYFSDLLNLHVALDAAVLEFMSAIESGEEAPYAVDAAMDAAHAIRVLEPPTGMLSVQATASFAATYCGDTLAGFAPGTAEQLTNPLVVGLVYSMRDQCFFALRDVIVEIARFADANGGYPGTSRGGGTAPAPSATQKP